MMRRLAHILSPDARGENPRAVALMRLMTTIADVAALNRETREIVIEKLANQIRNLAMDERASLV